MLVLPFAGEHTPEARGDPRQRRRYDGPRDGALLPGRARSTPSSSTPTSPRSARKLFDLRGRDDHHAHRRRPALAAGPAHEVRRDPGRRLPPALHPLLPDHAGVLRRGRDRLTPGGTVAINVGHPRAVGRASRRCSPPPCGRPSATTGCGATRSTTPTRWCSAPQGDCDPAQRLRGADLPDAGTTGGRSRLPDRLSHGLRGGTVYTDDRAPVEWLSTPRWPRSPSSRTRARGTAGCGRRPEQHNVPRGARRPAGRRGPVVVLGGARGPPPGGRQRRLPVPRQGAVLDARLGRRLAADAAHPRLAHVLWGRSALAPASPPDARRGAPDWALSEATEERRPDASSPGTPTASGTAAPSAVDEGAIHLLRPLLTVDPRIVELGRRGPAHAGGAGGVRPRRAPRGGRRDRPAGGRDRAAAPPAARCGRGCATRSTTRCATPSTSTAS